MNLAALRVDRNMADQRIIDRAINHARELRRERVIARTESILRDPDYHQDLLLTVIETTAGSKAIWNAIHASTSHDWMSLIAQADMLIVSAARNIAESENRHV